MVFVVLMVMVVAKVVLVMVTLAGQVQEPTHRQPLHPTVQGHPDPWSLSTPSGSAVCDLATHVFDHPGPESQLLSSGMTVLAPILLWELGGAPREQVNLLINQQTNPLRTAKFAAHTGSPSILLTQTPRWSAPTPPSSTSNAPNSGTRQLLLKFIKT